MAWNLRHEGSPEAVRNLSAQQVIEGLRDGVWSPTDEVQGANETKWQFLENHPAFADVVEEIEAPPRLVHQEATSLDMNALIDVCLVLLIFFIITTSYANMVQKVVPVPTMRPQGSSAALKEIKAADVKAKMVRVEVFLEKGKPVLRVENQAADVFMDEGKTVDARKMVDVLRPYVNGPDRKKEILLDAREVAWETVIQLQDAARSAGIQSIHYLTKK